MRTLLDALVPALAAARTALSEKKSPKIVLESAAAAATDGAARTKDMTALAGRSEYVPPALVSKYPDPGAVAVASAVSAMASVF